jgi:molybdenum cofactor cytidylyltransferase
MRIALIILAAGSSSRMGSPKQLLPWENTTVLGHALDVACACRADRIILVLGAQADKVRNALGSRSCEVVFNQNWAEGLGSSINAGLSYINSAVSESPVPDAVLLMLADQPLIDTEYLDRLITHFQRGDGDIVCTNYGQKLGVPAIFDKKYFPALAELSGDIGAGKLIAGHADTAFGLNPGNRGMDLDSPQDYTRLKNINSTSGS